MNKILALIQHGDLITYWHKGQQNNYASVKRVFGVVKFPVAELALRKQQAEKMGFTVQVGTNGDSPAAFHTTTEAEPTGAIDKALGVLKTVSAEWVVNCVTGKLIDKRNARFIGVSKGYPYWIEKDSDINDGPYAYPSVFGDNKPAPRKIDTYLPKARTNRLEALASKFTGVEVESA